MEKMEPIYHHGFDQETLEDFQELRRLRLQIAQQQLHNIDQTLADLKGNGLLPEASAEEQKIAVSEELAEKIVELNRRLENPEAVYLDEINFYSNFFADQAEVSAST